MNALGCGRIQCAYLNVCFFVDVQAAHFSPKNAARTPSTANAADATLSPCPVKVWVQVPHSMLHNFAVLSYDVVNTEELSGENTTDTTASTWPLNVWMHAPVSMLQTFAVLSRDADNTEASSPESTADITKSL